MTHPGFVLPNAISVDPNTQWQYVSYVVDPFALDYLPIKRGGRVATTTGVDYGYGQNVTAIDITPPMQPGGNIFIQPGVVATQAYSTNQGRGIFSQQPIQGSEWWHITLWGQEVQRDYSDEDEQAITDPAVIRAAQQHTSLKARITWTETPGIPRQIVADIGPGLDLSVGPTNQIFSVEILVPDPASTVLDLRSAYWTTDAGPVANGSVADPRFRADAYVACSVCCERAQSNRRATRYTQSVFLGRHGVIPNVVEVGRTSVIVPDGARILQVYSTEDENNGNVLWTWDAPPVPGLPGVLGDVAFVGPQTERVSVVQTAKGIQLVTDEAATGRVMTAVFEGQQ